MKKKHFVWALVLTICEVALLASCTVDTSPQKEGMTILEDGLFGIKPYAMEGHSYYVVYVPCSSCSSVSTCSYPKVTSVLHSPDCPCRKLQAPAVVTDEAENEDTDPFNW